MQFYTSSCVIISTRICACRHLLISEHVCAGGIFDPFGFSKGNFKVRGRLPPVCGTALVHHRVHTGLAHSVKVWLDSS